jgi:hypothetical protein
VPNWLCSTTSKTRQAFVSASRHEVSEERHEHAAANAELKALDAKPEYTFARILAGLTTDTRSSMPHNASLKRHFPPSHLR